MLLGFDARDDAAVYRISDDLAAVLTVDIITPIVDDPYSFGCVAAANALSDVFAMGGKPHTVLNISAFPRALGAEVVGEVMRGAADTTRSAGAVVVGGHTIDDQEPKFGLSVFGTVHPERIVSNEGAQPGDVLYLTKPLGTGVITTAFRKQMLSDTEIEPVIESMMCLNKDAAYAMGEVGVRAATDVTGFGLLGHVHEILEASACSAELTWNQIELFDGVYDFVKQGIMPGRTKSLREHYELFVLESALGEDEFDICMSVLCDPQTSGGMVICVPPDRAQDFERTYTECSGKQAYQIGIVTDAHPGMFKMV